MAKNVALAVGHRLRELRQAAGLTLEQVAERVSVPGEPPVHFTTIAKLERSQRAISLDWIVRLAGIYQVRPGDLLDSGRKPVRTIPLLGRIAAGNWQEAMLDPEGEVPVPDDSGRNVFALRPNGDSMNKIADENSILVVDPDQPDLLDGRLYAIMNGDGETTFKRYRADPPRLEPESTNPEHQPIPLGREPFKVIGRVIMHIRQL